MKNRRNKIKELERGKEVSRRFIDFLLGFSIVGLATSMAYPIIRFMNPPRLDKVEPSTVLAAQRGELRPNSGKVFRFGNEPAILIRKPDGEFAAFTAICTHLQCTVQYRSDLKQIWCACHDGHYDLTGRNIAGPPPRPLTAFEVRKAEDGIWVLRNS